MNGQIGSTPYDLRFSVWGIPIRVHPVFWLTSAFLAWNWSRGRLDILFVCVLCIFLAILVHELGHAVVTKSLGWNPEIVLYFFGGFATTTQHSTWKNIAVTAAGPGAGFSLYAILWFTARFGFEHGWLQHELAVNALSFSLFINLVWNLMNLIPVLPLDGGHITRELLCWLSPRSGMKASLIVSIVASGGVALWAVRCIQNQTGLLGLDPKFLALMFGVLCFHSVQQLQNTNRGYW